MKSRLLGVLSACAISLFSISANAALIGVLPATTGGTNYQAYYDDVADLTWLANANAAGATMTWADANAWAANLNIDGVTGWRLPDTLQPDSACSGQSDGVSYQYGCTGSEMGNLFYNVLGGTRGLPIALEHNSNYDLFSNVQPLFYWSATACCVTQSGAAFYFVFNGGYQSYGVKYNPNYAWAVHSGNVGAVPISPAFWLFGSGLIGMVAMARRRTV